MEIYQLFSNGVLNKKIQTCQKYAFQPEEIFQSLLLSEKLKNSKRNHYFLLKTIILL